MTTGLAVLYVVVGVGLVVAVHARRGIGPVDGVLLVVCWPLYAPFLLVAEQPGLDGLLPEADAALRLADRLAQAEARADQIAALLARPRFDAAATRARIERFEADGLSSAAAAARASLRNIERVSRLHARCRAELTEVQELMIQLETQVEFVRVAGGGTTEARALAADLLARVEGLDAVLGDADLFEDAA